MIDHSHHQPAPEAVQTTVDAEKQTWPPLRVIMAGGGTGGHLFPAIAIAREFCLRHPNTTVCFATAGNRFERSILTQAGFALRTITVEGIKRRAAGRQLMAAMKIPVGMLESIRLLHRFRPDLVFGVGSYAAGPVVLSAWLMGIRTVLHEQNLLPGVTNRILCRFAHRVYISFPQTAHYMVAKKTRMTGNPVRREILTAPDQPLPEDADIRHRSPFTVLVVGGSQGAHSINLAMADAVGRLKGCAGYRFFHQTGSKDVDMITSAYENAGCRHRVAPFFNDMGQQYRSADLLICRAGATTVAEVTALGKAVIFIPFPHAADNHQMHNARQLSDRNAAVTVAESELNGQRLCQLIEYYATHDSQRRQMAARCRRMGRPEAAEHIVTDCYRLLAENFKSQI